VKRQFQRHIHKTLCGSSDDPAPATPTESALHDAIFKAEHELLQGNPKKDKPWFVLGKDRLVPLCDVRNQAQMKAYHWPSVANNSAFYKAKKELMPLSGLRRMTGPAS